MAGFAIFPFSEAHFLGFQFDIQSTGTLICMYPKFIAKKFGNHGIIENGKSKYDY